MKKLLCILLMSCLCITACKHNQDAQPDTTVPDNFPAGIKEIVLNKCATSGCHNAASYTGAGGLLLDSWEHLFDGGSNGAVVIPYNTDNSSLLYFVNTNEQLGTTAQPTMPYNQPALSENEYILLRDWIANGAPDKNGNILFAADAATRQKIYTVQQGCDLVAVIDAAKNVVMRYIAVGKTYDTEQPNNIVMSPQGDYAYVSFWGANLIQKIDTRIDSVVAEVVTPRGFQKAIQISSDGSKLIACNWYAQDLLLIDATNMQVINNYGRDLQFIGGFAADNAGGFYATSQFGNTIYYISTNGSKQAISIDGQQPRQTTSATTPDPYRICMTPDRSKYFITCTNTNEVRVMNTATNELLAAIPVGANPQEMAMSTTGPYLFVSCMNDTVSKLEVGSVYVINYQTNQVVKKIMDKFFQPYALAVDDKNGLCYVFSRNEDKNGPPPHHSGPCFGRNGFYQVYNINTLERHNNKRYEISVDPYGAVARFK